MLTEKEKKFAEWLAKEVVAMLKKNKGDPDDETMNRIIDAANKYQQEKAINDPQCEKDKRKTFDDRLNLKNLDIGLSLYGFNTRVLNEEFILTYSSGKLKNYCACSYFLNRKYLKEKINREFNNRIKSNPAYFTYLELSTPVVNPLYIQDGNNVLSILLDIPVKELRSIIHYAKYIITKSGEEYWQENDIIDIKTRYEMQKLNYKIEFATGGEAIQHLLSKFDPVATLKAIKKKYANKSQKISKKIQKRIGVLEYFICNNIDVRKILISVLPIPQVNELLKNEKKQTQREVKNLYLDIASINERAVDLVNMNTAEIVVNNQKRLLQWAIDRLFRKNLKVYLCQTNNLHIKDEEQDESASKYWENENKKALLSLLGNPKGYDVYVWTQFVSMLFCSEISSDTIDPSTLYGFLWEHNALEDKNIWEHLVDNQGL